MHRDPSHEDKSRLRDPRAGENFAALRRFALTRLKNDHRAKMGSNNRRLKADWDDHYLSQLLFKTREGRTGAPPIRHPEYQYRHPEYQ